MRTWRKSKEELSNQNRSAKRFKGAGRPVTDEKLDKNLITWVRESRKEGLAVSGKDVIIEARRQSTNPEFKASPGWLSRFKTRHTLSTRQRTSIGQKLPKDFETKLTKFHSFVIRHRKQHNYSLADIYNMDETPLRFDMPATRTLHDKGVSVHMQRKGYIDEEGCLQWIRANFSHRSSTEPRRLLVWDSCATHLTPKVTEELNRRNIDQAVIPGGLTSLLQPLDVAVNKPLKDHMKQLWGSWMESGDHEYTNQGKRKAPTKEQVASWAVQAWERITPDIIKNGYLRCGITNNLDGTQDHLLYSGLVADHAESQDENSEDCQWLMDMLNSDTEDEEFEGF